MSLFTFLGGIVVGIAITVVFLIAYAYKQKILHIMWPG